MNKERVKKFAKEVMKQATKEGLTKSEVAALPEALNNAIVENYKKGEAEQPFTYYG